MPMDTPPRLTPAAEFIARAVAASLGLFGLLRLPWVETHLVLPVLAAQAAVAWRVFGTPALPVATTIACSGTDAIALCLAAVLAYPVRWRWRMGGAAGGVAAILLLNTVRIGTLGRAAASPLWFSALHLYVWPALLTLAIAGYVFWWMRIAEDGGAATKTTPEPPSRRFIGLTAVLLVGFVAAAPLYLESPAVLALARVIARAAAWILAGFGVAADAADNVLWTPRGGFLVSQECIATPLIPIYLGAVCAYAPNWRRLTGGILATVPLFTALGIARLLVVALPDAVGSPLFIVHAFYQLLLAVVVVLIAALWRHDRPNAVRYAAAGLTIGVLFACVLGPAYTRAIAYPAGLPLNDPQGAIAMLPSFQVSLYLALAAAAFTTIGWGRFLAGLGVLAATQAAGLLALRLLAAHGGIAPGVPHIRGWAVTVPLLVFAGITHVARTRR